MQSGPRLVSVNVGLPREIQWNGRTVRTGIWKDLRTVAYEPAPLDEPAAGNLLVCCSQPQRDVVIDL